ncbi:acetyl-CoA acetyltransferase, cytosolic-like isoform X1 [Schistocerca cancellata]|uniref:acetyl-CoA acetyltransferase, cytosolic-like isoform X1 n=1 Tax=Schistocerca cancellata TaxID=274614 RepID=UPI002118BE69|nr:acetyl-CoA acetyltransferase, cytosolic-like isoform X1 [Schistocerca cancellata]
MTEVVIVSGVRTPIGSLGGCFSTLRADELGTIVIKEALQRAEIDPANTPGMCEVIMGQVLTAGQGQNPARQAAIRAGLSYTVPAYSVNMVCGSGMRAVVDGYLSIRNGDAQLAVCGGQESMSLTPHVTNMRKGLKMGDTSLRDTLLCDGLTDAFYNVHMGETAERIADKEGITREQQDEFALQSQHRYAKSQQEGHFDKEIVPVPVPQRDGTTLVSTDEHPRKDLKIENLQRLKPIFRKNGTITAGNASGLNDGAAALVLMSNKLALEKGIKPMAKIIGWSQGGLDPQYMGMGPVPAITALLEKVHWGISDVDLFEINEAFACQAIAVLKQLGLNPAKVNVSGGAIALGHPLGASGARIIVTLLHALQRTRGRRGVAALCIGGGMGIAIGIEMC